MRRQQIDATHSLRGGERESMAVTRRLRSRGDQPEYGTTLQSLPETQSKLVHHIIPPWPKGFISMKTLIQVAPPARGLTFMSIMIASLTLLDLNQFNGRSPSECCWCKMEVLVRKRKINDLNVAGAVSSCFFLLVPLIFLQSPFISFLSSSSPFSPLFLLFLSF